MHVKSQMPYLTSLEDYSCIKPNKYWYGINFDITT